MSVIKINMIYSMLTIKYYSDLLDPNIMIIKKYWDLFDPKMLIINN